MAFSYKGLYWLVLLLLYQYPNHETRLSKSLKKLILIL